ncbi:hypothetical protein ABZV61_39270, partial [Streptomyces sp900116325]
DSFVSDSRSKRVPLSRFSLSRFPFRRFQPYQTHFRSVSGSNLIPIGRWSGLAFRLILLYQKRSAELIGFVAQIKESTALQEFNFQ